LIYIYKIYNSFNGKVYVGKTKQSLNKRIYSHLFLLKKNKHYNKHLQSAWNNDGKYFEFSIIETCDDCNWKDREMFWIKEFKSRDGEFGYNLTLGGDGGLGRTVSDYERRLTIERNKNRIWTDEMRKKTGEKTSERQKNYWTDEKRIAQGERTRKYSITHGKRGGWKCSEDFKRKRREYMATFKHSQESKDKLKKAKASISKSVICVENGIVFLSISEAAKSINTSTANIRSVLNKKIKKIKGFTFNYNNNVNL